MEIENDISNHQYIIRYKNLVRYVDFKFFSDRLLDDLRNEMVSEYRDIQINKILNYEEDTK